MKKVLLSMLCLLMAGLCACGETEPPEETTAATEQKSTQQISTETTVEMTDVSSLTTKIEGPYVDALNSIIKAHYNHPDQTKNVYYFLYDLDGDGTKELLLGGKRWELIFLMDVYTIQNGIAVRQKEFFIDPVESPQPILLKNGTIRVGGGNEDGSLFFAYYRFESEELKFMTSLSDNGDNWGSYFRRYPENFMQKKTITKAEFDRVRQEMEGDGQVVELDWKPLAEWGR